MLSIVRGLEAKEFWLAIVLGHLTQSGLSILRFRQGKWCDIIVEIDGTRH
jgi:hypothetical protein